MISASNWLRLFHEDPTFRIQLAREHNESSATIQGLKFSVCSFSSDVVMQISSVVCVSRTTSLQFQLVQRSTNEQYFSSSVAIRLFLYCFCIVSILSLSQRNVGLMP